MNKYYSLVKNKSKQEANLTIFGDITSYPWNEKDVSSYNLSKQLQQLTDVKTINVHINSYGGEVAEGLAIYNSLKNHSAKVKTYCDGFACSIASVIFMAGDERVMSNASLLMIHNAWSFVQGNANELRKQADDLDKITQASVNAYMNHVSISEFELKKLLDNETWLDCDEALQKGFATKITEASNDKVSQNVRQSLVKMILNKQEPAETIHINKQEPAETIHINNDGITFSVDGKSIWQLSNNDIVLQSDFEIEETETEEVEEAETTEDEEVVEPETTEEEPEKDEEPTEEVEDEKENNEKAVAFFKAIIGGM